jgi:hypothetical protein
MHSYLLEHRLRVFETRILMRIFGPKRDKVMGVEKTIYNKELYDLHFHQIFR